MNIWIALSESILNKSKLEMSVLAMKKTLLLLFYSKACFIHRPAL